MFLMIKKIHVKIVTIAIKPKVRINKLILNSGKVTK